MNILVEVSKREMSQCLGSWIRSQETSVRDATGRDSERVVRAPSKLGPSNGRPTCRVVEKKCGDGLLLAAPCPLSSRDNKSACRRSSVVTNLASLACTKQHESRSARCRVQT